MTSQYKSQVACPERGHSFLNHFFTMNSMTNLSAQNNEFIKNYYPREFQVHSSNTSRDIFSQVLKYYILRNNVLKILGGYAKPQTREKPTEKYNFRCHGNELQFIHLLYVNGSFELKC